MPTARELLEQVDALMRRNREEAAKADIPVLTDVVIPAPAGTPLPGNGEARAAEWEADARAGSIGAPVERGELSLDDPLSSDGDDLPVLTEVVEAFGIPRIEEVAPPLAPTGNDADDARSLATTGSDADDAPPLAPTDNDADDARWTVLAEDIRMQVLQRIDIFTDSALQDQLKAKLQPIVDDASARLVATINQQVGQLLRTYVAEAIEREIDHWRHQGK